MLVCGAVAPVIDIEAAVQIAEGFPFVLGRLTGKIIDLTEGGELTYDAYRVKAQTYGIPLVVIVLLLGIAWDLLFYWWTHRDVT